MPLKVTVDLVGYQGQSKTLSEFYIGRKEELKNPESGVHEYSVSPHLHPWETYAEFSHEYSDGAQVCVRKALTALESEGFNAVTSSPRSYHR